MLQTRETDENVEPVNDFTPITADMHISVIERTEPAIVGPIAPPAEFTALLEAEFPDATKAGSKHGDDSTVVLARPARKTIVNEADWSPQSPRTSPSTTAGAAA